MGKAKSNKARNMILRKQGFSVVEMMVAVSIIMILVAFAVLKLQPVTQELRANAAMDQVKDAFRMGRETAISQRRTIVIQFANAGAGLCPAVGATYQCIELSQISEPGNVVLPPYLVLPVEPTVQFMTFAGEPDLPIPDNNGIPAGGGVMFGGVSGGPPTGMEFQSDGTFTDGNANPISGTVFMGIANIPTSARAVAILGNTGRVHAFHGNGVGWNY
jgi:prepilin-type N-terminal cleavage/methylation domain-containing protein